MRGSGIGQVDPNPILDEGNPTSNAGIMWIIDLYDAIEMPLILKEPS